MNKSDLIGAMAANSGLSKQDSAKALDGYIEALKTALANDENVQLVGFGTFSVKNRKARIGRNPKTGEPIEIQASRVPSFKAGKGFKYAVN